MATTSMQIDDSTRLFQAFADPTRLRLLNLMRGGERCVCELTEALDTSQPKISRHLAALRRSGLVQARKEGLWVYYRLTKPTKKLHRRLIDCVGECFKGIEQFKLDRKRLQKCKAAATSCRECK